MQENKTFTGYWFLPQKIEKKVPRTLTYLANEKISLELLGVMDNYTHPFDLFDDNLNKEIIQGITTDGKNISLINCVSFLNLNFGALIPVSRYNCQYLIVGYHLDNIKDNSFNGIRIEIPALNSWYPSTMIRRKFHFDETGYKILQKQISIDQKDSKKEIVYLDGAYKLKLETHYNYHEKMQDSFSIKLESKSNCEISNSVEKTSFLKLFEKACQFKLFLSFATLVTNIFTSIRLIDEDSFQELKNGEKYFKTINLYYIDRNISEVEPTFNFLFTHDKISDIYPQVIKTWFDVRSDYAPIQTHLLNSIAKKKEWYSTDFLIIVQALEGYHRRFIAQTI